MRWLLKGVAVLAALVLLMFLYGLTRPEGHVASTQARYSSAPDVLWATLADFGRWPEWNSEVVSVAELPERSGQLLSGRATEA